MQERTREDDLAPVITAPYGTPQQLAWNIGVTGSTTSAAAQRPVLAEAADQRVQHGRAMRVDDALGPAGGARGVAHGDRIVLVVLDAGERLAGGGASASSAS